MNYKSLDKFELKNQGTVFIVENDKDRNRDDMKLIGTIVFIDTMPYTVKGVEAFLSPTILKGEKIGILV